MNLQASAPSPAREQASIVVTFPDQTTRTFARGVTGREIAAAIAKSLAKSALVVEVDGVLQDLDRPIRSRLAGEVDPRRGRRGPAGDPPRLRPCHGGGGAGPVSRHAGHDRPGDRERLLLRLLPQRAVLDRRSGADRGADGRDREGRPAVRARGGDARRRACALRRAWASGSSSSCSTPFPRASRSRSTTRATGSTSAAVRTVPRRAGSAPSS